MTRTEPTRYAKQRNITFLCQECGGDLEPARLVGEELTHYQCQKCSTVFVYGVAGWQRVMGQGRWPRIARSDG